mgnify:CR=1 FL=1
MKDAWIELTQTRNNKLSASDWTQLPDCPLSDSKKAEWETYRTTLRQIPNNLRNHENYVSDAESNPFDGSIMEWSYPTEPS